MHDTSDTSHLVEVMIRFKVDFVTLPKELIEWEHPADTVQAGMGIAVTKYLTREGKRCLLETRGCLPEPPPLGIGGVGVEAAKSFLRRYVLVSQISSLPLCEAYIKTTSNHPLGWGRFINNDDLLKDYALYCSYYRPDEETL